MVAAVVLRIPLVLLLPILSAAIELPTSSVVANISRPRMGAARSRRQRQQQHHHHRHSTATGFLAPTAPSSTRRRRRRTIIASLAPDYFNNNNNNKDNESSTSLSSYCYVPPYGMVPRPSSIVMNMQINDYNDDRFRKKMASKRNKDPVIQDFGSMGDWQASKTGLGRLGDDKVGDDRVSERFGGPGGMGEREMGMGYGDDGFDLIDGRRPPPPMMMREDDMFEGEGGNFWVNPTNSMDGYPMRVENEGMVSRSRNRSVGRSRGNRRNNRRNDDDGGEEWWETRPRNGYDDDDGEFDDFDDEYRGEYGVPPPTRSRSSFRSGAPPPPLPVKQFYDKLFWFGFDPDVTRPTDRTMFGGTRGKFNAMDLLNDREQRQQMRLGDGEMRGGGGRSERAGRNRRTRRNDSVIQDFGDVRDWNARKTGGGRSGGVAVGDDRNRPNYGYDDVGVDMGMGGPAPFPGDMPPPPPPGMPEYDFDPGFVNDDFLMDDDIDDGMDFFDERLRRRSRGGRRRGRDGRRRGIDPRAEEYDMLFTGGVGGGPGEFDMMEDEYMPPSMAGEGRASSRRRRGFAYKYNNMDLFDDDDEYIDVEPKYASDRDLDMARGGNLPSKASRSSSSRRRRSWEDRAIEMDRVPPSNAVAWGPNGRFLDGDGGDNPLDRAAMEALGDIKKSKRYLERKEVDVEDAKEEVVNLKADANFCENKLEDSRGGRESSKLEQELGYILRDVEDASRNLRMARAERDAASERVSVLEERNWALLSEFEAARTPFEEEDLL